MLLYFHTFASSFITILPSVLDTRTTTSSANMSAQTPTVDRPRIDAELVNALILRQRSESFDFDLTESEELLFTACIAACLAKLQELLANESFLATAIESKKRPFSGLISKEISNLYPMLHMAIRARSATITKLLLEIADTHKIPYDSLILRDTIFAAIDCQNVAVLKELANVFPKSLNFSSLVGNPLGHTIGRSQRDKNGGPLWDDQTEIEYVKVLLEKGANPNAKMGRRKTPGSHLTAAAKFSPAEVTMLLIQYGAKVPQSGALQAAVEANRLEVIEMLVAWGAGVNERLQEPTLHSNDPEKIEQHLSETPLHIAVREKAYEAAAWLLQDGASRNIQDSHHQSAADLVALGGDAKLVEIFQL
jgi:ankyrin repeat protein